MGMGKIVSWYQKKIGIYDKEHWEKTSEDQILHGLSYVSKKSKLRTELIDVDLVRGSSFPKSKPKHGIVTVARLALKRVLFFPFYRFIWKEETSPRIFWVLLLLYILQLVNMSVFIYYKYYSEDIFENISSSEIFVPFAMMYILVMIHLQIVSTHTGNSLEIKNKPRRVKRAKRRNTRIRTTDNKSNFEVTIEKTASSESSNKYKKSLKSKKNSSEDGRLVLWDSKVESDSQTPHINEKSKNLKVSEENIVIQKESREKNNISNSSIGRVVPQDDDGFESLTGNGSSENGEELLELRKQENSKNNSKNNRKEECDSNEWDNSSYPHKWLITSGIRHDSTHIDADVEISDSENVEKFKTHESIPRLRNSSQTKKEFRESNYNSSCDSEDIERCSIVLEGSASPGDWLAITTNSEECSYSSEIEDTEKLHLASSSNSFLDHPYIWEYENFPSVIPNLSSITSDKVSCTMWDCHDCKKVDLSVIDISTAIITKVESMSDNLDYFYGGLMMSLVIGLLPSFYRLLMANSEPLNNIENAINITTHLGHLSFSDVFINFYESFDNIIDSSFGTNKVGRIIIFIALIERCALSSIFIFLLVVAERTFKQRLLYAKLFSHLTSLRRSIKSELPHFRLNKVRNIKNWLSVRSYLKKQGPQRSVNVIVSAAFIITLLLLSFLSIECLKDSLRMHLQYNLEALIWCMVLGVFLLRFMTLGTNINIKYRNLSVLLTEQINLYLQIEQKPNKKDELMVANSVLKLAADLLKELESPFKISGLAANPYLYTITKVVILSALSAVLSELLGFKLKLHKLKVK